MENCEFCGTTYLGRTAKVNLKKHLIHCISNPKSIRYKCEICEKEFEKRHAFNGHKKSCGKIIDKKIKELKEKIHECRYCKSIFDSGLQLGGHVINCKSDPSYEEKRKNKSIKLSNIGKKRKLSIETKNKISKSRKKYLQENPDKVPYKLNHSSKESYPEKYFNELFINENIKVERYYYIGLYELDFCIVDKKIDIEIDGEQHYVDERIEKSDINRNKFLENLGWTIIRIRWNDKRNYIVELKRKIVE